MEPDAPDRHSLGGHEWRRAAHVARYRESIRDVPQWDESEGALREHIPARVGRFLDIGTGEGRLIELVRDSHPAATAVGVDLSPHMLSVARERFAGVAEVELVVHDLAEPLAVPGPFDLVVSAFAIHHLDDERKRSLYGEVFGLLSPGGTFLNLEHVASASERLHIEFLKAIGLAVEDQDPSDRLAPAWEQVRWLREIGFADADCHWKWREMALIGGRRSLS